MSSSLPVDQQYSMTNNNPIVQLHRDDPRYPSLLREIPHPPASLRIRGDISALHRPALAVVGTRRPTSYGLSVTRSLLEPVARAGLTIISGLALGIDTVAHRVAVELGAPTIAVLGCGIDRIYPWENQQLAEAILATGGALISEFPDGTPPLRQHFPQRNRIISGLARAVLLVEAGEKSGALITAKFAVDQNRDVLVVPGPITSPTSVGPLNWLKLGATPITSAEDILRLFQLTSPPFQSRADQYQAQSPAERAVIDCLRLEPLHIDELTEKSRLDNSVVSATLSLLEINGVIHHLGGLVYTLA